MQFDWSGCEPFPGVDFPAFDCWGGGHQPCPPACDCRRCWAVPCRPNSPYRGGPSRGQGTRWRPRQPGPYYGAQSNTATYFLGDFRDFNEIENPPSSSC